MRAAATYTAIGLLLGGLALLPVPRWWRWGAAMFTAGLVLAPIAVAAGR